MLLLGLALGLVVGAGGVGLAWGFSTGSGAKADAEAVCGIIARTPDPADNVRDINLQYAQRWTIGEVVASIAATDGTYKPLANALREVQTSLRTLRPDKMRVAIDKARQACDDL
jgi:hypothetical protein